MLKSGECRSTATRGTWDRAAWMLHEAGSWGSSPVSFAIFPLGCWWKTAGGCFPPFFSSLFSLHTPYHAEPVPVTMVTQGEPSRETEGCKQKRDPLSHFRNLQGGGSPPPPNQRRKPIRDIITQWHLILYYICIVSQTLSSTFFFFVPARVSLQKYPCTAAQTQNGHLFLWLLCYSLVPVLHLFILICFQRKSSLTPSSKKDADIYFQTICRVWILFKNK